MLSAFANFSARIVLVYLLCGPYFGAAAQTASSSPSPSPTGDNTQAIAQASGQSLQTIVVSDTGENSVNPIDRPVSSIYGNDMEITDIPRSVTSVTHEALVQQNVMSVSDRSQLTPSSLNPSRRGITGTPTIRGDLAEVYVNGQRELTNQNAVASDPAPYTDKVQAPGSKNGDAIKVVNPTFSASLK